MKWMEPLPEWARARISAKMYKRIMALAKEQKCSFSDTVRTLLTNGLAATKER
jgi:hypothetical protein